MDAAAEIGRNPVSTRFTPSMEMSRLTRAGTAEAISRDQILRRERGRGNIYFPCLADHEQDWQLYLVDPYSCYMRWPYIYTRYERCVIVVDQTIGLLSHVTQQFNNEAAD